MRNSTKFFLFLLFLLLINAACNNKRQVSKPISLQPFKSLSDELNDSTFFRDVWVMKFADNKLFLGDNKPQILELGPDLNLLGSIYKYGRGPGEFTDITAICFVDDSLFVYDRTQARILIYDNKNHFVRGIQIPDASSFNMAVDDHRQIFLSTADRTHPITEFNTDGQEIRSFGSNTIAKDSKHFQRNERFLFIHNNKLVTIARSEPLIEIYNLKGKLINKTKIAPPSIQNIIARVKKMNTNPNFRGFDNLFLGATIFRNNIYLMVPNHTYVKKFTYLFKYRLEPNGHVILKNTFKLFRSNHNKLLYGFSLAAVGDHKIIVYDLMGKRLLVFKDKRL